MADNTSKRKAELAWHLFKVLLGHPDGLSAKEALRALADATPPTEWEQGAYANGGRRFEWLARFATIPAVKAGWLAKAKGTWTLTDAGATAFRAHKDPIAFFDAANRLYRQWESNRTEGETPDDEAVHDEPTEIAPQAAVEVAEEDAWRGIEHFLQNMQPYELQDLVASLLQAMGYHVAWVAPPGKDGGVDIIAFNDPLGTKPPRLKVQVKRLARKVDVHELRSFISRIGADDVGLFINTGGFTRDAQEEARALETRRMSLVDLEKLFDLWVEHYDKLDDSARRRMPLKQVWFLAPEQ